MSDAPSMTPLTPESERLLAILTHVLSLFFPFLAPFVSYLAFRGRGNLITQHATAALNFQLSLILAYFVTGITLIGLILWPVIAIYAIVQIVLAAIAAGEGSEYKFGFSYNFVK
jgi:uncharacterized Tic20 family protein